MTEQPNRVSVTDVDMPFLSMVHFMVKWAIAAIPAMLLLMILGAIFWGMLLGFFTSLGARTSGASDRNSPSAISTGRSVDDSKAAMAADQVSKAYLSKISVRNVGVGESVLGETGAFGEIKNEGDSTLKEVEITIFCLGPDGKPVFEKQYTPVLQSEYNLSEANKPLKPGYSRKFGVKLDDAPAEWTKKVTVSVTGVKF